MKKIRQTLKAHILGVAWWIQLSNLELEVHYPEGICTEKSTCFSSGNVELQMCENGIFFTPVKYTLVCCTPWVSWVT